MRVINSLILSVVLIIFASCKNKEVVEDDSAIRYRYFSLEKSGWKSREHSQKIDDINFTATEVPISYYILKSEGKENLFKVDSIEKANQSERVIEFNFIQDDEKDLLEENFTGLNYDESVKYMSFGITNDFFVVTSKKDTVRCSGVTMERNFKIAPYQKVLLFFEGIKPQDEIQLVYNDHLFKKGILKFKFQEKTTRILL
ncbi:hypothetical protein [Flavobacterium sp. NRK1]|uniref:hypothetical protein n=1 Tax=Flavobacterium sp. NRK1 TaxID=2954929 RepID=UPI002091E7FF|nr:hypothetical protein [Flavobacterium sp. NRK1]MCO6147926.1 hypothetical protein [Flavobacterium sp. NRK1]